MTDSRIPAYEAKARAFRTIMGARCLHCNAGYPDYHSPVGSLETLCDNCGWCSDWPALVKDLQLESAKRTSRKRKRHE